ncbi:hypothetical protein DND58_08205 [Pseudomonas syringae pv. pisi]|uniref:ThiF family adenylyltransferase n=1 Tax=Pseudomonas coronafaciens TaxID=53409 RepID=UPI0005A4DE4E|nr:ThiF family adenylyltransferase [Pseudomonas coronafaciens]KGS13108.1 hypothetical protein OA77_18305 [Pseudomonas coronafaciens]PYD13796.1 hypothetical protein DND62_10385 [Pseudomonas syringae pv. pisi]PYD32284.1 hypothetical protein DND58_08205 [Pseudomonas syringae pv. pisi]RMV01203.1 hypothetical protein ALP20_200040 [Pseudomonas coronafaciens pv. coronafaciens]
MPDGAVSPSPFDAAVQVICDWLDGPGAAFATRAKVHNRRIKMDAWDITMSHPVVGSQRVQISIRPDFPASTPKVHFSPSLCLVWPHVEETGEFCHGVEPSPDDYAAPARALETVLSRLEGFWLNTQDPNWIEREFHRERLSYWARFCTRQHKASGRSAPQIARVILKPFERHMEGSVACYFEKSPRANAALLLASPTDNAPHNVAVRHGWNTGTLQRGVVLYVQIEANTPWSPSTWAVDFISLANLVDHCTGSLGFLARWISEKRKPEKKHELLMVVLVESGVCYGYVLQPGLIPNLTQPQLMPLTLDRVDSDWTLARDHQLGRLARRRAAKILLLGCGSLGSPLAELLARAGIGHMDLLDMEFLEAANCARHLLGANNLDQGKAQQIAKRLLEAVPDVHVTAYWTQASSWISQQCKPGSYDLVIDCTGESSVRALLAQYREASLGGCSVVHAWMEPQCAAGHVVYVDRDSVWPANDPTDLINVGDWKASGRVELQACGRGFHPYGAADAWHVASFAAERVLAIVDGVAQASAIWSYIRSSAYFEHLDADVDIGPLVPKSADIFHSVQITRPYAATVKPAP